MTRWRLRDYHQWAMAHDCPTLATYFDQCRHTPIPPLPEVPEAEHTALLQVLPSRGVSLSPEVDDPDYWSYTGPYGSYAGLPSCWHRAILAVWDEAKPTTTWSVRRMRPAEAEDVWLVADACSGVYEHTSWMYTHLSPRTILVQRRPPFPIRDAETLDDTLWAYALLFDNIILALEALRHQSSAITRLLTALQHRHESLIIWDLDPTDEADTELIAVGRHHGFVACPTIPHMWVWGDLPDAVIPRVTVLHLPAIRAAVTAAHQDTSTMLPYPAAVPPPLLPGS